MITYYRTDLFCSKIEQTAFEDRYNKKLPCTPEEMNDADWNLVANIGEFFTRSTGEELAGETLEDDFYGISYQAGKSYDFSSVAINGFIWQHGGEIWDELKVPESQALGVVNSEIAVSAFEHYLSLLAYMPPIVNTGTMDPFKVDQLFRAGKIAWALQWTGFGEATISSEISKVYDKVDFALHPGIRFSDGSLDRTSNLSGQVLAVTSSNDDETLHEAIDFLEWWSSEKTQTQFAKEGGQSALHSAFEQDDYVNVRPWNQEFKQSLIWQRNFWNIPEFIELLAQQQAAYDRAITGEVSAREALNSIASYQQKLLTESGYID